MNRFTGNVGGAMAMVWLALGISSAAFGGGSPQGAAFTYQGVLKQSNAPVNGSVDLQFKLFDSLVAGTQIGSTLPFNAVSVVDGVFTSSLDFGALAFNGEERWLEISVASPAGGGIGPFTTLAPRQKIASAPYTTYAMLAAAIAPSYTTVVNFTNPANTFAGSGAALTNLNPANFSAGTAGISITGLAGNVSGVVAVANGGTGANNAATARSNLGAAAASHTHAAADIASGNLDPARLPTGGGWTLSSNLAVDTDLLFINPTNNLVGIGTTSPGAPIDVQRTSSTSIINPLATFRSAGTGSSSGSIRTQNSAGNHWNFGITQGGDFALNYNLNISQATDLLRITPAGSMGLGTITPSARLHVAGDVRLDNPGTAPAMTIEAPASFGNASIALRSASSGRQAVEFRDIGDAGYDAIIGIAENEENLAFAVNGAPRMTLTPTGRVGINTVAPSTIFHVNGNSRVDGDLDVNGRLDVTGATGDSAIVDAGDSTPGGSPGLIRLTAGDAVAPTFDGGNVILQGGSTSTPSGLGGDVVLQPGNSGTNLSGVIKMQAVQGTAYCRLEHLGSSTISRALLEIESNGSKSLDFTDRDESSKLASIEHSAAGDLNFYVGFPQRMRIASTGLVGIGRNPAANNLEVEGSASKTAAGSWLANSDARIKTDIETVTSALDTLDQVRLTSFRYTPEYLKAHPSIEDRRYLNVIAQEFARVFPEHVKGSGEFLPDGSEILQVDTYPLTIYSAAAIQELRAQKDAEISQLRVENESLRADLDELRMLVQRLIERETRK